MEKQCRICGETKPETEFYSNGQGARESYCKPCKIDRVARMARERPRRFQAPEGMKRCQTCHSIKSTDEFHQSTREFDGRSASCRGCVNARQKVIFDRDRAVGAARARKWRKRNPDRVRDAGLKQNYGLPYGTYDKMLAAQSGRCAICKTVETGARNHLHVDHDHDTGTVRGLLCGRCNTGIGQLRHERNVLLAAIDYLDSYSK